MNNDHTPDTQLRDLVHQLTRQHNTPVHLHGELIRHRTDPALLTALSTARTANIGQGTGTKAAHERTTLNITAAELYTAIQHRTRQWAIHADVPRHWHLTTRQPIDWTDPTQLLSAWHTRTLANPHFNPDPHIDTLHGWVRAITDLVIDPPRHWTLNAPCPLCNHRWTLDSDGHQIDTLHITERDPATTTTTTCRNCEAVWTGITGARALRIAIDDATRIHA